MRLPRFLWVPFELGRPFGAPHEPAFQRRVLHEALALVERTDGPVVLADFPADAPRSEDEAPWACPVSFAPAPSDADDLTAAIRREIGQLAPWAELAPAPTPNSGLRIDEMVERLTSVADRAPDDPIDIEAVRLVADDVRSWYLHAVARQPGSATSNERNRWFWRETAVAHLLGEVAAALIDHPDPTVRTFADRAIVPRDHWDSLVPDRHEDDQDA
ncbi:MAG: hypothetical protein U5K30_16655 [Acidimicrobiales bacterium]|nr:hypothetical protein [Acidimicrobiales bacterium]